MKSLTLLFLTTFNLLFAIGQSEHITLSDGIGEVSAITYKGLIKSIGAPDTIIENSFPRGKKKPTFKIIYSNHGVTFVFHLIYKKHQNKIGRLASIKLTESSNLSINNLKISKATLISCTNTFGEPKKRWRTDENDLVLDYQIKHDKPEYFIRIKLNPKELLTHITIDLFYH